MRFKKTLITSTVVLALSVGAYIHADGKVTLAEINAMSIIHESLADLENRSELIISGTPISSQNHVVRDKEGFTQEAFTITEFKIEQIFSSSSEIEVQEGSVIKVSEPVYIVDNGIRPGKTKFTVNGYESMGQNERNLLVLRQDQTYSDLYVIVGTNDGKYSLETNTAKTASNEHDGQFKEQLIAKYNIK